MAFDPLARVCLGFDDVLLVPQYSEIKSRHDVDIEITDWAKVEKIADEEETSNDTN